MAARLRGGIRSTMLDQAWKLVAVGAAVAVLAAGATSPAAPTRASCRDPGVGAAAVRATMRALASGRDLWGEALIAAPDGPTYDGARRYLAPLLYARAPGRRPLTASGVYYVPSADPDAMSIGLHVADGSQIIRRRVGGRSLTIRVGAHGDERYGSCLGRLETPRLLDGWLPVLQTSYADAGGVRYRQESFTSSAGSYIALAVDARDSAAGAAVEFGRPLVRVPSGSRRDLYIAWTGADPQAIGRAEYAAARDAFERRWRAALAPAARIEVPEKIVMDARRALLVQDLILGWRYSVGNAYEEFSYPESPDVAQVLGEQGFPGVERAILDASLTRRGTPFPNWKRGERLLVSAVHVRRAADRAYLARATPALRAFVAALGRDLHGGLLGRERYSADVPDLVIAFHGQVVAWAGLRAIASVWAHDGRAALGAQARGLAGRLERGLRDALRRSERRLPDGSLFVPARLLDGEVPYRSLVEARSSSYWNLVTPFALSTGFLAPGSADARGVLRYMLRHGSRLLGLVRAGAYALYGRDAPFPVSGTDEVYGTNVARFLADNDEPDQLVLSLYGELAAAMTPGTFVAGEGASVAPLDGRLYRAMYLPPNGASNAAFLETLRVLLVHETLDARGEPLGLQLAYATPRPWLRPGARIAVADAPTSFGPVSFEIDAAAGSAHVRVDIPRRAPPRRLTLRLRLPGGARIRGVRLEGRALNRFDAATGTIDLSGRRGRLELEVRYGVS